MVPLHHPEPGAYLSGGEDVVKKKEYDASPYFRISHSVLEERAFKKLPASAQVLFMHLCRLRNRLKDKRKDNSFWRTDQQLLRDTGLHRRTLLRAKIALVRHGFMYCVSYLDEVKRFGPRYYVLDNVYSIPDDKDALKRIHMVI